MKSKCEWCSDKKATHVIRGEQVCKPCNTEWHKDAARGGGYYD